MKCCWIFRTGYGPNDSYLCSVEANEVWHRKVPYPDHVNLIATAPHVYYCDDHRFFGPKRHESYAQYGMNVEKIQQGILDHFDIDVITKVMSNESETKKVEPTIPGLVKGLQEETARTLEAMAGYGPIPMTGQYDPLKIKVDALTTLASVVSLCEHIKPPSSNDRFVALQRAGTDLRNALRELAPAGAVRSDFVDPIIAAWDREVLTALAKSE